MGSPTNSLPEHPPEDIELLINFEKEQFQLYERRRVDYENQATATTAGALTLGALLVAGADKLADLGQIVRYGTSAALVGLVLSIAFAAIARFASWGAFARFESGDRRRDALVGTTLNDLRRGDGVGDSDLRRRLHDHWQKRAESAWRLGLFKKKWMVRAGLALVLPVLFLMTVAVALLF